MYKMRIKKWGLDKHNHIGRVAHMVRLKRDRAASGRRSKFTINKRGVDWSDVERYLDRRPDVLAKIEAGEVEIGDAKNGIICRTPSPDPAAFFSIPGGLRPGKDIRYQEEVLLLFRNYMEGAFDQGIWRYCPDVRTYMGPGGQTGTSRICAFVSDIWSAVYHGATQAEAIKEINEHMDHLTWMIKEQDSSLFVHLVRCYYYLHSWDPVVCKVIARFVADMCEVLLGSKHPMTDAWRHIVSMGSPALQVVLENAARLRLDHLEKLAEARCDRVSMIVLEEYFLAMSMRWQGNAHEINQVVRWILQHVEDTGLEMAGDHCRLLLRLSSPQIFYGEFDLARKMLGSVKAWLDRSETSDLYYSVVDAGYHFNMALLHFESGDVDLARGMLIEAVGLCTSYYGPTKHLKGHVHHWLMSYGVAGNPDKAAKWQDLLTEAVNHILDDWAHPEKSFFISKQGGFRARHKLGAVRLELDHELAASNGNAAPLVYRSDDESSPESTTHED